MFGELASFGEVWVFVGGAELLRAVPGDFDFDVFFPGGERGGQFGVLFRGEFLFPGVEEVPDPVERVTASSAVSEGVLLHSAADLV